MCGNSEEKVNVKTGVPEMKTSEGLRLPACREKYETDETVQAKEAPIKNDLSWRRRKHEHGQN